ncbi:MAG: Coenzyme F420 hydrogenase/dehydrogenase, beta subunit C-terminal domain [Candidatus Helarchaeota archaeon]
MGIKIFEDLRREIVDRNLCNLCGACLAVCTANNVNALTIHENRPQYNETTPQIQKCLECGICYLICGQIPELNEVIEAKYGAKPPLGSYKYLTIARTTDLTIQEKAQDGGIVTSILKYLLEKNFVDGVIVNQSIEDWNSVPKLITSSEELVQTAGTRYTAIPAVQELGNYRKLNLENPRLAFVGTPCQVQTIRKMQALQVRPGIFVKYLIGLFCMENFDYRTLMKEKLQNELKINLNEIKKLNIKKNFFITLKNGEQIEIPLNELKHLVRENCHYCTDFTNIYADISVGGIGAPQGYSTVLIRTEEGGQLFTNLLLERRIEEFTAEPNNVTQTKAKILSLIKKLGQTKYENGQKTKSRLNKNGDDR